MIPTTGLALWRRFYSQQQYTSLLLSETYNSNPRYLHNFNKKIPPQLRTTYDNPSWNRVFLGFISSFLRWSSFLGRTSLGIYGCSCSPLNYINFPPLIWVQVCSGRIHKAAHILRSWWILKRSQGRLHILSFRHVLGLHILMWLNLETSRNQSQFRSTQWSISSTLIAWGKHPISRGKPSHPAKETNFMDLLHMKYIILHW